MNIEYDKEIGLLESLSAYFKLAVFIFSKTIKEA
jgi:hypothetical protein